jgi:RecB family exonuclease
LIDPVTDPDGMRPLTAVGRPAALSAVVAELRAACSDPDTAEVVRRRAATHLARLAGEGVPGAHPGDWYGLGGLSAEGPLRGPDEVVPVSPSKIEQFTLCPLRWLLESHGGSSFSAADAELGTLVHELAAAVPDGDREQLNALLDAALAQGRLGSEAQGDGWAGRVLRERAVHLVSRFADYARLARADGRVVLGVEEPIALELGRARVTGSVDRVERGADGKTLIIDLKTGKQAPPIKDTQHNPQLGVYQLAVEEGALPGPSGVESTGGAMLVCLGTQTASVTLRKQAPLRADAEPGWARELVATTAEGMAGAVFPATVNPRCPSCPTRRACPVQIEGRQVTDGI